ncbi:MAG: hypothetical protein LBD90_04725 [Bifidobacteriaceae bacterium]|jgi:hypothetical protein|nr:hypothetical protein [Bifidobacteriaceae bacterium]
MSVWQKIKARRLVNTTRVLIVFVVLFAASLVGYYGFSLTVAREVFMGLFTSLLASILITAFELYTKYKDFEDQEFIDNIYAFGIHNLYFTKRDLLSDRIEKARSEIWISGYRLILTADLTRQIMGAVSRGVAIRMLICPVWEEGYRLVYGDGRGIIDNYFKIFSIVNKCRRENAGTNFEVHFTPVPLFNDTYRVDDKIITSPYMHNRDIVFGTMSAHDFFTYELDERYKLFQLMEAEYVALWDGATGALFGSDLPALMQAFDAQDLSDSAKAKLLRGFVRPLAPTTPGDQEPAPTAAP